MSAPRSPPPASAKELILKPDPRVCSYTQEPFQLAQVIAKTSAWPYTHDPLSPCSGTPPHGPNPPWVRHHLLLGGRQSPGTASTSSGLRFPTMMPSKESNIAAEARATNLAAHTTEFADHHHRVLTEEVSAFGKLKGRIMLDLESGQGAKQSGCDAVTL